GMILVSADEPGMHSSQNEQDNRNYAKFAKIALFEPSNSQEAKDMLKEAYKISEIYDTPVLYRVTTRLCHSKGIVNCEEREEVGVREYRKDIQKRVTVPAFARPLRVKVEERLNKLLDYSNSTPLNYIEINDKKIGIIASGVCHTYAKEVFGKDASYLKLGFTNPLPDKKIKEFADTVDTLYVIEENDKFIEDQVKAMGIEIIGKDLFPYTGEMTPDVIRKTMFGETKPTIEYNESLVVPRPPTLCSGCPHRGFFYELGKRKNVMVSGDIGCYSLAFADPYNSLDSIVCMGASLSAGHGAQQVFNMNEDNNMRVVGVLGDSTFFHTGINSLLDISYNQSNAISVILDNRITGMTGHQQNPGTGYTLQGKPVKEVDIEKLVLACGIENVRTIDPNNLKDVKETIDWALKLDEPSVIITRWPCVLKKFSSQDKEEFKGAFTQSCSVDNDACIGCKLCIKSGCPSLSFEKDIKKACIDKNSCVGCEVCSQICPKNAIHKGDM
ncbi:MAG: thiamine pyrophosphate-dependent enzyme, partial [Paraclostridium sp.]